jgi:hypothetical protein
MAKAQEIAGQRGRQYGEIALDETRGNPRRLTVEFAAADCAPRIAAGLREAGCRAVEAQDSHEAPSCVMEMQARELPTLSSAGRE